LLISAVGDPPPGTSIWGLLSSITSTTVGESTAKCRVYGVVTGALTCTVYVKVYNCESNAMVTNTEVDLTTGAFEFYVLPGARFVVELSGSNISTKSLTLDIPAGVSSYNMT
jgi:hypothetical protein